MSPGTPQERKTATKQEISMARLVCHSVCVYLPRLQRLPKVNSAANFRDFNTMTGVRANAWKFNALSQSTSNIDSTHQSKTYQSQTQARKKAYDSLFLTLGCTYAYTYHRSQTAILPYQSPLYTRIIFVTRSAP